MSKFAFDKWQRANDKLNDAEAAVQTARFDFRTAETQFHNEVAIHGPYVDGDDIYYVENGELKTAKKTTRPASVPK